jgi:hypothetical protein
MKTIWIFAFCFFTSLAHAHVITVTGIKVTVTADSAAAAREKALDQAHELALQKVLSENFPESSQGLPPHDTIVNMVNDFSIEREKTTPKSYTASLTFQFDSAQIESWLHKGNSSNPTVSESSSPPIGENSLKILASYSTLPEWLHIKKTLETAPGAEKVNVLSLSPQSATIQLSYRGQTEKLQQHLLQQDLLLSPQEGSWLISSNSPSRH